MQPELRLPSVSTADEFPRALRDRFYGGDMDALRELMMTYKRGIYLFGLRLFLNRDKAADFCQDVFVKAYEKREKFNPAFPIKPWLFQMAANLARDRFRKKREIVFPDGNIPERAVRATSEDSIIHQELKKKIWSVVSTLNSTYREIIALRFSSDMSLNEIASVLGISLSAAKVRLCRGIRAFEAAFKAEGGEEYVV